MRLWHYKLIPVLPRQQLISQWRECCGIAKLIFYQKTPNHILINKVTEYPAWQFMSYCHQVITEMKRRGYSITMASWIALDENLMYSEEEGYFANEDDFIYDPNKLFSEWHNDRYLRQCYYNLQEKYDCGGITDEEWQKIEDLVDKTNVMMYELIVKESKE